MPRPHGRRRPHANQHHPHRDSPPSHVIRDPERRTDHLLPPTTTTTATQPPCFCFCFFIFFIILTLLPISSSTPPHHLHLHDQITLTSEPAATVYFPLPSSCGSPSI
ncbi:hypothetical protein ACJBU6_05814 [Exserohilum turcicum]